MTAGGSDGEAAWAKARCGGAALSWWQRHSAVETAQNNQKSYRLPGI